MKRLFAILPIFLLVTMLAGCSSDDSQDEYDGEIVELNGCISLCPQFAIFYLLPFRWFCLSCDS